VHKHGYFAELTNLGDVASDKDEDNEDEEDGEDGEDGKVTTCIQHILLSITVENSWLKV